MYRILIANLIAASCFTNGCASSISTPADLKKLYTNSLALHLVTDTTMQAACPAESPYHFITFAPCGRANSVAALPAFRLLRPSDKNQTVAEKPRVNVLGTYEPIFPFPVQIIYDGKNIKLDERVFVEGFQKLPQHEFPDQFLLAPLKQVAAKIVKVEAREATPWSTGRIVLQCESPVDDGFLGGPVYRITDAGDFQVIGLISRTRLPSSPTNKTILIEAATIPIEISSWIERES